MNGTYVRSRSRSAAIRALGWLAVASMMATAFLAPSASPALAGDKTEITICHGTGSQSNPYVVESPAINSSGAFAGQLAAGHNDHIGPLWFLGITVAWGDIIPPYEYAPASFSYPGLNWTTEGQAIYNNGCTIPTPTAPPATEPPATEPPATEPPATEPPATEPPATEPPATEPPATEPPATEPPATEPPATEPPATEPPATEPPATEPPATEPPATEPPATEPPATEPPATEPPATEPPAEGGVEAATGTPRTTLPPTSTLDGQAGPSGDSWRILLLGIAAFLAGILVLAPSGRGRRARR